MTEDDWVRVSERLPEHGVLVLAWDCLYEEFHLAQVYHGKLIDINDDDDVCFSYWAQVPPPPTLDISEDEEEE